jgi:hypothetical protein
VEALHDKWSASSLNTLTWGEIAPSTHWIESYVGPRAGLNAVEKNLAMPGIEPGLSNPQTVAIPSPCRTWRFCQYNGQSMDTILCCFHPCPIPTAHLPKMHIMLLSHLFLRLPNASPQNSLCTSCFSDWSQISAHHRLPEFTDVQQKILYIVKHNDTIFFHLQCHVIFTSLLSLHYSLHDLREMRVVNCSLKQFPFSLFWSTIILLFLLTS